MKKTLYFLVFFILGYFQAQASEGIACTMEYAPVCGSVQVQCITAPCNPVRQTFSNTCMAQASNATDITVGECGTTSNPIVGGDRDVYGCIGSAGYTWSATENKCVRPWEKKKMSPREALKNGTWMIQSLNGKNIMSSGTLSFSKNTFSAKLCNIINGRYGVTLWNLVFRNAFSTMMYCDSDIMEVENAMSFTRAKFMVGSDTLTITTKKWDVIVWKKSL